MSPSKPPADKKIVGIDLGASDCLIAHINEDGSPETILNCDGMPTTPAAVLFEGPDNIVVGQLARDVAVTMPENVVSMVRREMGRDTVFALGGYDFRPEEISAMILKKLKQDAEARLSVPVEDAVITVPVYFGAAEREATQDAGEMAGLTVARLLSEPAAVALAASLACPSLGQVLLVYDLGGSAFEVTLLKTGLPAEDTGTTSPAAVSAVF